MSNRPKRPTPLRAWEVNENAQVCLWESTDAYITAIEQERDEAVELAEQRERRVERLEEDKRLLGTHLQHQYEQEVNSRAHIEIANSRDEWYRIARNLEQLGAENKRLRELLQAVTEAAEFYGNEYGDPMEHSEDIIAARAALEGGPYE